MFAVIPKPAISPRRKAAALAVAFSIDFLQLTFLPLLGLGYVLDDILDLIAAVLLAAICGFRWQFILAFLVELIPAFDLLPTWTAVAALLPTQKNPIQATANANNDPSYHPPIDVTAVVVPPVRTHLPKSAP